MNFTHPQLLRALRLNYMGGDGGGGDGGGGSGGGGGGVLWAA